MKKQIPQSLVLPALDHCLVPLWKLRMLSIQQIVLRALYVWAYYSLGSPVVQEGYAVEALTIKVNSSIGIFAKMCLACTQLMMALGYRPHLLLDVSKSFCGSINVLCSPMSPRLLLLLASSRTVVYACLCDRLQSNTTLAVHFSSKRWLGNVF